MIKLTCPDCDSDNITHLDVDSFICLDCQANFTKAGAGWEEE